MSESTEVTLEQVEACLALFRAVGLVIHTAVASRFDQCVDVVTWARLLNAYSDVGDCWDW